MHGFIYRHHQKLRREAGETKLNLGVLFMDRLIWLVALLGPLATIPQVMTIWAGRETEGLSLFSWSAYSLFSVVWLVYSLVHKEKVLLFNSILWIIMNSLVLLGILTYS
ncbi:MAG: hypothetical protein UY99_C0013G0015 [Parcubacteria group bacterium GW2011_GWA1_59_11]|nr:MAG: hypothetical protein UY99_C0013G0015 [Parcubacteria group bacterium GW2011_GWA1_59_11]